MISITEVLRFFGLTSPPVSKAGQGTLYFDIGSNTWKVSGNGSNYFNLLTDESGGGGGSGTIGGTISTNQVAVGSGLNTINGTNNFTFDGTKVTASGYAFLNDPTAGLKWADPFNLSFSCPTIDAGTNGILYITTSQGTLFSSDVYIFADQGPGSNVFQIVTSGFNPTFFIDNLACVGMKESALGPRNPGMANLQADSSTHRLMLANNQGPWSTVMTQADIDAPRYTVSSISYAATTNLDLSHNTYETLSLTGDITFTTSNKASGRLLSIKILCDSTPRNLTFPASWIFLGSAVPSAIAANKTAILTIMCYGTNDSDIVAAYSVQP